MKNETVVGSEQRAGSDDTTLLLFYLLLDESKSMDGLPIETINRALKSLCEEMAKHPAISEKVRVSIIAFSEQPQTIVGLSDLADLETIPGLTPQSNTDYAKAFVYLRDCIERDVAALLADGIGAYRPAVFFMSDGAPDPGNNWKSEFAKLVDPAWKLHPNVISFGIGQADESVISQVSTLAAYMADSNTTPADAINEWATALLQTLLRSADAGAVMVPAAITGYHQVGVSRVA